MAFTYNELNNDFNGEIWDSPILRNGVAASGPITVTQDGVIQNTGGDGLVLLGGAYTLTVNGQIASLGIYNGIYIDDAYLPGFAPGITKITVGETGIVSGSHLAGGGAGIVSNKSLSVTNAGTISGDGSGIYFSGDTTETLTVVNTGTIWTTMASNYGVYASGGGARTITNSGDVYGSITLFGGIMKVTNSLTGWIGGDVGTDNGADAVSNAGNIDGSVFTYGGNDIVTNSGTIGKNVDLGGGLNKFTNAGTVANTNGATDAVFFGTDNDTLLNTGKILNGNVQMGDGTNILTNSGSIAGVISAGSGIDTVSNSITGSISGNVNLGAGVNKFTNAGTVSNTGGATDAVFFGVDNDTLTNSGKILNGNIQMGEGLNTFTNSGTIGGNVGFGIGNDIFTNSGTIDGYVGPDEGNNKFTNSGKINGTYFDGTFGNLGVGFGNGNDTMLNSGTIAGGGLAFRDGTNSLINSGTIAGDVFFGSGADTVSNSGKIDGSVNLGDGLNKLTNSGTIFAGVYGGSGNDTVTNTGHLYNSVDLGAGDDKYLGSAFVDNVFDANGSDTYALGAGNDFFGATGQTPGAMIDGLLGDKMDGGLNAAVNFRLGLNGDRYEAGAATAAVFINADSVAHGSADDAALGATILAIGSATGANIGSDTIANFETFSGGQAGDIIFGGAKANLILGNSGFDHLHGGGGNDWIDGGNNDDEISGDAGADHLTGGLGFDSFVYHKLTDSAPGSLNRDVITDFTKAEDAFNFTAINPLHNMHLNTGTFIDTAFDHTPGAVRILTNVEGWLVQVDSNGDSKVDMSIQVNDINHAIGWDADNFIFT